MPFLPVPYWHHVLVDVLSCSQIGIYLSQYLVLQTNAHQRLSLFLNFSRSVPMTAVMHSTLPYLALAYTLPTFVSFMCLYALILNDICHLSALS